MTENGGGGGDLRVRPLAPADVPLLARVFGPAGRRRDSCWCQRFRRHDAPDDRTALEQEVRRATVPVGLLASDGEDPVGWTRVVPRASLPGVTGNRALARLLPADPGAWWVACTVVRRDARGRGVGAALLEAAADWAERHGGTVLDGHPVDTDASSSTSSPSALFTGTRSAFAQAGFAEIGRTHPTRPVMRRRLRPLPEGAAASEAE